MRYWSITPVDRRYREVTQSLLEVLRDATNKCCIGEKKTHLHFDPSEPKSSPLVLDVDVHLNYIFLFGVSKREVFGS